MCALGHCPVVGGNWLQSSAVHRVWHGVARWINSLPYSKSLLRYTNLPLYQHQSSPSPSHYLHRAWQMARHSSSIFSLVLHLTNVLLCDPKTSNLDSSVHNTFSHGIPFISQNKIRLSSLRRKFPFSGHFESIIEPSNADAPDTQLAQRKASFIASIISTTVFSCDNIIAQGFSNHQLAF